MVPEPIIAPAGAATEGTDSDRHGDGASADAGDRRDRPDPALARLIALDWGTSSLRGWLFDDAGRLIDRREAPLGILAVREARFAEAFESFCAGWLDADHRLPVIASGMIGSRQGWREAAYLPTPASFDTFAGSLLEVDQAAGRPFRIVPGLVTRQADGSPDVMRGEECQVFGVLGARIDVTDARIDGLGARALQDPPGAAVFVLPGTHSKWVATHGTELTGFRSCMTGELYAVMRDHSILGRLFAVPPDPDADGPLAAFDDGVDRALAEPGAIGHLLFTVRTEALLGERPAQNLPAYLSGLLIGAEIGDGLRIFGRAAPPCIIAAPTLAARYQRAFHRAGISASIAAGEPARDGLLAIARHAGLILP